MGGLSGALRFMVAPDIKSYADIKGKTLDVDGVRTVLKLRSEFALPKKLLSDPFRYFDENYYQRALQK